MFIYGGKLYTNQYQVKQARDTRQNHYRSPVMVKKCSTGMFDQVNILKEMNKIWINDFNIGFKDQLDSILSGLDIQISKVNIYELGEESIVEIDLHDINKDKVEEIRSKLELLCTS